MCAHLYTLPSNKVHLQTLLHCQLLAPIKLSAATLQIYHRYQKTFKKSLVWIFSCAVFSQFFFASEHLSFICPFLCPLILAQIVKNTKRQQNNQFKYWIENYTFSCRNCLLYAHFFAQHRSCSNWYSCCKEQIKKVKGRREENASTIREAGNVVSKNKPKF